MKKNRPDANRRRLLGEPPPIFLARSSLGASFVVVTTAFSVVACGSAENQDSLTDGTGGSAKVPSKVVAGESGRGGSSGAASSTGGPPDAGADGAAAGTDGSTPSTNAGACCSSHPEVGCKDSAIEACVCKSDPRCCSEKWDDVCVALVDGLGCGTCKADCCSESAAPGCADSTVEACVCGKSADCCNAAWDSFCVLLVTSTAGGSVCGQCK